MRSHPVAELDSRFCGLWFWEVINQNIISWAGKNGKNDDSQSLKCSPLEGCITPRKVAETSTQLHGFKECHGESFAVCNRAFLKSLAFAASDSSVINQSCLSWAEWNGKNADVHSLKCKLLEGFITRRKVGESSTQLPCHGESFAVWKQVSAQGVGCCSFKFTEIVKQNSLSWVK